jgi:CTP:molybdopterin cytidylyltransferase MocA
MPDVGIVLLAAGGSTRMGQPKQLLAIAGQSMLRRAAVAAVGSGCTPAIVVLGAQAETLHNELTNLPITIAVNDAWQRGLGGSIRCGLQALLSNGSAPDYGFRQPALPTRFSRLTPSPGTPGEGRGEGVFIASAAKDPHPNPLPEYREREQEQMPALFVGNDKSPPPGYRGREKDLFTAGVDRSAATSADLPRAVVILLCDQPFVTADVIRRLVSAFLESGKPICVSAFSNTFGPPVVIDSRYFDLLLALPDDQGGKAVWTDRQDEVHFEPCLEAAIDIDTPGDYERWTTTTPRLS